MNTAEFITIFTSGGSDLASVIFAQYKAYVLADSGTVEADTCTTNKLRDLIL
jgi:hypothetical protein